MFSTNKVMAYSVLFSIGVLLLVLLIFYQAPKESKYFYRAAVVEYYPVRYSPGTPPETILMENVERYSKFIKDNKKDLDIIVFPESTITTAAVLKTRLSMLNYSTTVPNPLDVVNVCESSNEYPQFFIYLACAAKEAKVYLVVNLIEQKLCNNNSYYGEFRQCSNDTWDFYNTDVVFDRNGVVVARYRKYHLFGEVWMNRTINPDISIFRTDFGIKFGLFTCFDILFQRPSMDLVKLYGINNVIYPSMWFSELPFLTALQSQMQWAYEMDVVMLSAGANNCEHGSGGTGIYQGKSGAVIFDYPANGESKVYIADIPKVEKNQLNVYQNDDVDDLAKKMDKFYLMKENLQDYRLQLLDPIQKVFDSVICHNKLCCQFSVKTNVNYSFLNNSQHYYYFFAVYNGMRSFKKMARGGIEVCGIVTCTSNTTDSCAIRFPNYEEIKWPITFTDISIKANFSKQDSKIQYPNTLLSSIRPISANSIEWKHKLYEENSVIERTFNLLEPQNRLLTFAIYGRDFSQDTNLMH